MSIRAKMRLSMIVGEVYGGAKAIFHCEYDPRNSEDVKFCKATPNGMAEYIIDNPEAVSQLVVGQSYYFDIHPVTKEDSAS